MAFSDPQSVTISGAAVSLPRTGLGPQSGVFEANDGLTSLSINHTKGRRVRHIIRLDVAKIVADPLITGVNTKVSMSAQLHVDVPLVGYTVADQELIVKALTSYLTTAKVTQLLGNES